MSTAALTLLAAVGWACALAVVMGVALTRRRPLDAVGHDRSESPGRTDLRWACDPNGCVTFVDSTVTQLLGFAPGDLIGRNFAELVTQEQQEHVRSLLSTGRGWRRQRFLCRTASGGVRWLVGEADAVTPRRGRSAGLSGRMHPVSELDGVPLHVDETRRQVFDVLSSDALRIAWQPIVSLADGRTVGAEALARFPATPERGPQEWFAAAAQAGMGVELELHAVRAALTAASALPPEIYISVNVSAETLVEPALLRTLLAAHVGPARVVLELTEHTVISDYRPLRDPLTRLRQAGVRLAVDDAGAGFSSFRHIVQLAPHIIKMDRSLVAALESEPAQRALAAAVVMFAAETGASVVAEGVETTATLLAARRLGIAAVQGYLLGRPSIDWVTPDPAVVRAASTAGW